MKTRSYITLFTAAAVLASAGLAFADNKPAAQVKGRPTLADVQKLVNKSLVIKRLKEDRAVLVGPVQFGVCAAAKSAETKYEACEDRCADWAAQQPLTGADLANCGDDMSAAACADKIVDEKSKECIRMTGNPGCRDEQVALIKARQACKECKEELTQIATLNKQKAAKEAEIAKLHKQLIAAKIEAAKIEAELAKLGKPCASASSSAADSKNGIKLKN